MSKRIVWLHVGGWVAAGLVLLISLFSAAQLGDDRNATASGRGFYVGREILPDHVLYPVLMVIDRIALQTTTSPEERVYMQVNYAYRRLNAAQALVDQGKHTLALTTLTKAQKYLNQAAQEALKANVSATERRVVIRAVENQNQLVAKLAPNFTTFDQGVLNHLRSEAEILEEKLIDSIK